MSELAGRLTWFVGLCLLAACTQPVLNPCGGGTVLADSPGEPCDGCGVWECEGAESLTCVGPIPNECGGCEPLSELPGTACGLCGFGQWRCDGSNVTRCEGDTTNACGGCEALAGVVGEDCGACGGGSLACAGANSLICEGAADTNACGGCASLPTPIGDACGACGETVCAGLDDVHCADGGCALGVACTDDVDCATLRCSNGHCVPDGLVYIPAGEFVMGAPLDEPGRHPSRENGQHHVSITRPLLAMATTVTQGEWFELTGTRPAYFSECGDACPVERVSWWEMLLFADLRSREEGLEECYGLTDCVGALGAGCGDADRCTGFACPMDPNPPASLDCNGYRLPTEAEWEYMARAGTTSAFLTESGSIEHWGATPLDPGLDRIAWYLGNSGATYDGAWDCSQHATGLGPCGPHPVGMKAANAWGLFDMTGNVWERVFDWAGDLPEPGSMVVDPTGPATGTNRRMRGGPFNAAGQYMRVAWRTGPAPSARFYNIGFRLVRTFAESGDGLIGP